MLKTLKLYSSWAAVLWLLAVWWLATNVSCDRSASIFRFEVILTWLTKSLRF